MEDKKLLMVIVSGKDRPGILAALMQVLVEHDVAVLDIEQASLQDLLGLSFLIDTKRSESSKDSVIKDLLFEASRFNLTLNFRLYTEKEVQAESRSRLFMLTFFGGTRALAEFSAILGEENVNIEMITSLTQHRDQCVEMTLNADRTPSLKRLKARIMAKSRELNVDLALQKMEAYRKNKRMIFFDMDSTLLDMEVIDELAALAGVEAEVSRVTEKAMRGDLDFEEALIHRVALLKGLPQTVLEDVRDNLKLSEGVEELAATLKGLGYIVGVVTGGFAFYADHLKERLGFDFAFANKLEVKNGALTGRVVGDVVDAAQKARLLNQHAHECGVLLDQTVAVGDGANDALMLGQAGLGLAYNAKAHLDRVAGAALGRTRLMNILYLLGITEDDVDQALGRRP